MKGHITLQYIHSFDTVLEFLQSQGDKNERDLSLYEFRVYLTHQIEKQTKHCTVFGGSSTVQQDTLIKQNKPSKWSLTVYYDKI